tara:strand:+ start:90 stop:296 length:207 start_codon:yes stop_codon:yes gene_type:complete
MFTLDEKQYDETKMSDKGKVSYVNIQNISNRRNQLAMEQDNLNVLEQHYVAILKEELPEEIKAEEKEK